MTAGSNRVKGQTAKITLSSVTRTSSGSHERVTIVLPVVVFNMLRGARAAETGHRERNSIILAVNA